MKWVLLGTKVLAAKVKNTQNEELGKMEDLLLDKNEHVQFAIIGRGGVLGVGANYLAAPWSKLGISTNRDTNAVTISIDSSKAELEKAPLVKGDNYATLLAPGFADEVRHFFGVTKGAIDTSVEKK